MELKLGLNILIGGNFGSEGKGVVASYLANLPGLSITVTNRGPNSGSTFYYKENRYITRQLTVSGITAELPIYLCAGSVINLGILLDEIKEFDVSHRLIIHPNATIISNDDIAQELDTNSIAYRISSTQNGVGQALAQKANRTAKIASAIPELSQYIGKVDASKHISLMEVPQGIGLSLNSGFYPYVTSRNVSVAQALSDAEVNPKYLGKVICVIRSFPIRVSNLPDCYSGNFYPDSTEIKFSDINQPEEYTTCTNRPRRIATFSYKQYKDMLASVCPDYIVLNFTNYCTSSQLAELLQLQSITHICKGPYKEDIIKIGSMIKKNEEVPRWDN